MQDINLNIASGQQRVGLVGCNGVGKSTLLKLLVGISAHAAGHAKWRALRCSAKIWHLSGGKWGYIFQDSDSQLFMPTVAADVAFAAQNYGYPTEEVAARTHRALQQVHIEDCADRPGVPAVRWAKETCVYRRHPDAGPGADLDGRAVRRAGPEKPAQLNRNFAGLPCAMLIASHDLDFIYDTCDRVVLLYEGRIAADGPAEEILHDGALLADCDLELPLRFQSI